MLRPSDLPAGVTGLWPMSGLADPALAPEDWPIIDRIPSAVETHYPLTATGAGVSLATPGGALAWYGLDHYAKNGFWTWGGSNAGQYFVGGDVHVFLTFTLPPAGEGAARYPFELFGFNRAHHRDTVDVRYNAETQTLDVRAGRDILARFAAGELRDGQPHRLHFHHSANAAQKYGATDAAQIRIRLDGELIGAQGFDRGQLGASPRLTVIAAHMEGSRTNPLDVLLGFVGVGTGLDADAVAWMEGQQRAGDGGPSGGDGDGSGAAQAGLGLPWWGWLALAGGAVAYLVHRDAPSDETLAGLDAGRGKSMADDKFQQKQIRMSSTRAAVEKQKRDAAAKKKRTKAI